jgi:hypothetical protein
MQKQLKKDISKKNFLKLKGLKVNKIKALKGKLFLKKILKHNLSLKFSTKCKLSQLKDLLILNISVGSNNIFCNVANKKGETYLKSVSSGYYKMKVSKRSLRFYIKDILNLYLKDLSNKKIKFPKILAVRISAPIKIRKQVISFLKKALFKRFLKQKTIIIEVNPLKVFNGCRAGKYRKKKRKSFKILKPL